MSPYQPLEIVKLSLLLQISNISSLFNFSISFLYCPKEQFRGYLAAHVKSRRSEHTVIFTADHRKTKMEQTVYYKSNEIFCQDERGSLV